MAVGTMISSEVERWLWWVYGGEIGWVNIGSNYTCLMSLYAQLVEGGSC